MAAVFVLTCALLYKLTKVRKEEACMHGFVDVEVILRIGVINCVVRRGVVVLYCVV